MKKNESNGFNIEELHAAKARMNAIKELKSDIKEKAQRKLIIASLVIIIGFGLALTVINPSALNFSSFSFKPI
ncbi:hypothetical protein LGK95_17240 [Clostridium algoriphilum]|uniref:hypothetical protein n=1 Tax=Clostridium algoriphilum TaxID=198347 RepID=UPI001CF5D917|nr:hypothetical protein [Clostridium algoriphilum]MCB2295231.1 hypothetical protein [Clostridium algoriphilum]